MSKCQDDSCAPPICTLRSLDRADFPSFEEPFFVGTFDVGATTYCHSTRNSGKLLERLFYAKVSAMNNKLE